MFDIGMQELIVIFIVALLVIGPKKLPELGKTLGKGLAELKKSMQDVKEKMDQEVRDIKDPLKIDTNLGIPKWDEIASPYGQAESAKPEADKNKSTETAEISVPQGTDKTAGTAANTGDKPPAKG